MLLPHDFGPIYVETNMARFPVEPWNTFSNLIFLAALVVYAFRTRLDFRRYPVLVLGMPVLLVGFVGGTMYHATRAANLWLLMDFIPIAVLALFAAYHFWLRVVGSRLLAGVLIFLPPLLMDLVHHQVEMGRQLHISLGYISQALTILIPAFLFCRSQRYRYGRLLAAAFLCFAGAISFRLLDGARLLPMGTHFLWHLLGGCSSMLLMEYIYRSAAPRAEPSPPIEALEGQGLPA